MTKDNAVYLRHMLDAIGHVNDYIRDVSMDRFMSNKLLQDGVVRELEIVGEASRNLSDEFRDNHPEAP